MSRVLIQPSVPETGDGDTYRVQKQLLGLFAGEPSWSAPLFHTGLDDDGEYAFTLFNNGAGGHFSIPGVMQVVPGGVIIDTLILEDLTVNDTATIETAVIDTATITTANVTSLNVSGTAIYNNLSINGNLSAGDANTDLHTFVGISHFRNLANTFTAVYVDPANARTIVGSSTPMGSDTTPALQNVGRFYTAPETANDFAIEIRRSSAATNGWRIGVENTPVNLAFVDDGGVKVFAIGDSASTYQAIVTGDFNVTDDADIAGDVTASRGAFGATTFSGGGEELRVVGQTRLEGATAVTTGGLSVVGGEIVDTISLNGTNTVFSLIGTTQTQSTVGAAGGSSALPANPSAYLKIVVGATNYVIPFYNA